MRRLTHTLLEGWNRFFFASASPASLSLFRIAFGAVVFLSILGKLPFRDVFYGVNAIVSYQTMSYFYPDSYLWFRWMPERDPALLAYFLGLLAIAASFTLGFRTRLSSVLLYAGIMSLSNRNMFVDNSGDDLLRNNCFIMMFADSGAAYSIDKWRKVRRGRESPGLGGVSPWPQRLLQLQLCYLYFDTAYLKMAGNLWLDGTAIYYALNYIELKRFALKPLFYYLWQIKLATYSTLAVEFAAPLLVWFRPLRYWVVAGGVALHLGINLALQFPVFQYVMIASWLNFVDPEDAERAVRLVRERFFSLIRKPASEAT